MNRLPLVLTMIEPGELRSDSANHGAPTSGTVGPHQASSMISSAAPELFGGEDAVAGVGDRADGPFGGDRRALVLHPHLLVVLEAAAAEDDAAAGPDQPRLSDLRRRWCRVRRRRAPRRPRRTGRSARC